MAGEGYASAGVSAASSLTGSILDALKQGDAERARELALEAARQTPDLQLPDQNYSQIAYQGDFTPGMYDTPEAAQATTVADSPEARAIQMQALQKLIAQGNGAADAQNAAGQFQALDSANQMANAREGAIRQSMERKGQGGTGISALMRAQAAQMGANRAKSGTLDAYSQAALQKLQALGAANSAAGAMRGQDIGLNAQNAGILNDFNRFNVSARNVASQHNVDTQNAAGLRNLNTRQDIGGRNTGITNSNIDRLTNNAVLQNNAAARRTGNIMNALGGQAQQASNTGSVYSQLGQQGGQMFNNIGAGITAANNANPNSDDDWKQYTSDDGSLHSSWAG
jgi:hypothetical protein